MASIDFILRLIILLALATLCCCWHNPHGEHLCEGHGYEHTKVEECFTGVLAKNQEEDWLEIIIYFKNHIFPIASHAWKGDVGGAVWALKDTVVKLEATSFIVRHIIPNLFPVDPKTVDLMDDTVHSKPFQAIISISGFSTDIARIRVSLAEGKYYDAIFYVGSKVALSVAGVAGLHPHFHDTYEAFTRGDYWGAAARLVALPLPIAKQLLWLLPLPIFTHPFISAALDVGHSFIVVVLGDPSFLKPFRDYAYQFMTKVVSNDEVWRIASRGIGYIMDTVNGHGVTPERLRIGHYTY